MGTISSKMFSLRREKNNEVRGTGSCPLPSGRSPPGGMWEELEARIAVFGTGLFKLGEYLMFNIQLFKSGLDQQVSIAQFSVIGREDHVAEDGIRLLFFVDLLFGGLHHF